MKIVFTLLMAAWGCILQAQLPYLSHEDGKVELIVDGQPFLMLCGELSNSATGSTHLMAPVWQRIADKNLNSVLAAMSWELVEPKEGQYDFTLLDSLVCSARRVGLKVGLLWFGSWKNGLSTYMPTWAKTNQKRFPLAKFKDGQKMNSLSVFGKEAMEAESKAFGAMMAHLKDVDTDHTVILVQIENEMGTLDPLSLSAEVPNRAMRDYSSVANKAFEGQVPQALMSYLSKHREELHPAIRKAWEDNGAKHKGTWEEVFGCGQPVKESVDWQQDYPYLTEEIFMTWYYATYVEQIAKEGKRAYPLPLYVNAWLKQSGGREPGRYPSGGPQAHMIDIWRAAAPSIDFIAPDIYIVDCFDDVCRAYTVAANPLFIPETKGDPASAARAFYAFGRYDALCYSPFAIESYSLFSGSDVNDKSYDTVYGCLKHLIPYILKYRGTDQMDGLFIDGQKPTDSLEIGDYSFGIAPFTAKMSMAVAGIEVEEYEKRITAAGMLVIELGEGDFLVAGYGDMLVKINKGSRHKANNVGLLTVDEIFFTPQGEMLTHRLNGDETSSGGVVIPAQGAKVFRVKMYAY